MASQGRTTRSLTHRTFFFLLFILIVPLLAYAQQPEVGEREHGKHEGVSAVIWLFTTPQKPCITIEDEFLSKYPALEEGIRLSNQEIGGEIFGDRYTGFSFELSRDAALSVISEIPFNHYLTKNRIDSIESETHTFQCVIQYKDRFYDVKIDFVVSRRSHGSSLAGIISPWVGIFALGSSLGIGLQVKDFSTIISTSTLRKIICVLSIAAGTIHLMLIQDHMAEAFEWGIFFAAAGMAQLSYGFVFLRVRKRVMHYLGAIGNATILAVYVYSRLFTPPFSPELSPVTEIDAAGIITGVIEAALVILLLYSLRFWKSQKFRYYLSEKKTRGRLKINDLWRRKLDDKRCTASL